MDRNLSGIFLFEILKIIFHGDCWLLTSSSSGATRHSSSKLGSALAALSAHGNCWPHKQNDSYSETVTWPHVCKWTGIPNHTKYFGGKACSLGKHILLWWPCASLCIIAHSCSLLYVITLRCQCHNSLNFMEHPLKYCWLFGQWKIMHYLCAQINIVWRRACSAA